MRGEVFSFSLLPLIPCIGEEGGLFNVQSENEGTNLKVKVCGVGNRHLLISYSPLNSLFRPRSSNAIFIAVISCSYSWPDSPIGVMAGSTI